MIASARRCALVAVAIAAAVTVPLPARGQSLPVVVVVDDVPMALEPPAAVLDGVVYVPLRPQPKWMLFDVAADPDTRRDLAAERPERVVALRARMLEEMRRHAPVEESNGFLFWDVR